MINLNYIDLIEEDKDLEPTSKEESKDAASTEEETYTEKYKG